MLTMSAQSHTEPAHFSNLLNGGDVVPGVPGKTETATETARRERIDRRAELSLLDGLAAIVYGDADRDGIL